MATTKTYRTKVYTQLSKRNYSAGTATAIWSNSSFHGIATAVPYNPRLRHLMPKPVNFQPSKVIVLKVNPSLDKATDEPLNHKAAEARSMFANHRKNH